MRTIVVAALAATAGAVLSRVLSTAEQNEALKWAPPNQPKPDPATY